MTVLFYQLKPFFLFIFISNGMSFTSANIAQIIRFRKDIRRFIFFVFNVLV